MMAAAGDLRVLASLAGLQRDFHVRTIVLSVILLRTIGLSKTRQRTPVPTSPADAEARALSGGDPDGT
jgi:hypothetical protein